MIRDRKKLVILVMCSSSSNLYNNLESCIRETWFNNKRDDVDVIFYKDNQNDSEKYNYPIFNNFDLVLPINDGLFNLGHKTIMAFEWVNQNYDYEYIYRSNLGAFVDIKNILSFLSDKPKDNFYCGIVGKDSFYLGREVEFASGSGYFLSKNLVELVVKNKYMWKHNVIDDVALGELLSQFNIKVDRRAKRKNITDGNIFYQIGDNIVEYIDDDEVYHIRLRSDNREEDIKNMKELYKNKINMIKLHYGGYNHFFKEEDILYPEKHYEKMCSIGSDINEHLPTLKRYASECETVTEMGVRFACSTWAFIEAKPKKLTCIDIDYNSFEPSDKYVRLMCDNYVINFNWITGDSLQLDMENTDLLFIDTLHTYKQLLGELNRHESKVSKYIILHDTTTFGHRNEDIYQHASSIIKNEEVTKFGLIPAIDDFLLTNKYWIREEVFDNNNGLTVLKRV